MEDIRWQHAEAAEIALVQTQAAAYMHDTHRMKRIHSTGAWLSVLPSTVNGTDLEVQEWRESLFLRYSIDPPDLPDHYNSCGAAFSICHALECKKGSLIMARHNEICDGVADLSRKAFTPTHVCDDPKIFTDRSVCGRNYKAKVKGAPPKDEGGLKGGILIPNL